MSAETDVTPEEKKTRRLTLPLERLQRILAETLAESERVSEAILGRKYLEANPQKRR